MAEKTVFSPVEVEKIRALKRNKWLIEFLNCAGEEQADGAVLIDNERVTEALLKIIIFPVLRKKKIIDW